MRRTLVLSVIVLFAAPLAAAPVPCAGGTIDFTATSYDPMVALTTFNVGQLVRLTALPVGITPSTFAWTIDPPNIKDYEERIGTTGTGPFAWSTTPLAPADLAASEVLFYWKPSPTQIHPMNAGPVTRSVSLDVTVGMTTCTVAQTFTAERNNADIDKQAEDFYTRNHRNALEPDLTKGRVLDDHIEWHTIFGTRLLTFLPWHHEFIDRFNLWRAESGYPPTIDWYPGNPIPTGVDMDDLTRGGPFDPNFNRIPSRFTLAGGSTGRLADYATLTSFSNDLEGTWHGQVHCAVGGTMCTFRSPQDPLFFRWHGIIDLMYANYCSLKSLGCAGIVLPPSDMWMADNPGDLAAGGTEPSSGLLWMSPSVWNRNAPAACTPADPVATVTRTCGSAADHEDPIATVTNYLYATIRNDRPGAVEVKYVEVAVYIANASTGLTWPVNFGGDPDGALPETRQFLTVNVQPGQVTDIGPLPWVPPVPMPSDHWCIYVRLLSEQSPISVAEGPNIGTNVQANNNVIWRNLHIVVNSTDSATFTVRNVERQSVRNALRIDVPQRFFDAGHVRLLVPRAAAAKWKGLDGMETAAREPQKPTVPAVPVASKDMTPRERELRARIAKLHASVRGCAREERMSYEGDERGLLEIVRQYDRAQRACRRNDENLVAFKLTAPRASINDLALAPGQVVPVTIEFGSDIPDRADFPVLVSQERADGNAIGGMTYIVRTGAH
jgi:hypothetical protein